jgi:hypothetical protein
MARISDSLLWTVVQRRGWLDVGHGERVAPFAPPFSPPLAPMLRSDWATAAACGINMSCLLLAEAYPRLARLSVVDLGEMTTLE